MTNNICIPKARSPNLWQRLHDLIDFTDPVAKEIKKLASSQNWDESRQKVVLEALKKEHYSQSSEHLKKLCRRLEPSQLHLLLKAAAATAPEACTAKDPTIRFKRLSKLLTLEQIEKAIRTEYPTFESALGAAKEMVTYARYYNDLTHPPTAKQGLHRIIAKVLFAIETTLDTLLRVFGFYSFLKDIDNDFEAQYRLQAMLAIFAYLSSLVTLSIAIAGSVVTGAAIVGAGVITAGALLAVYQQWLKPAPRSIKGFKNLTTEALAGDLAAVDSRKRYLDAIAEALIAGDQKPKTHPLLIGRTGVGKTEMMKGFARAVAEGRYPALKGKQVFYINTAELLQMGGRGMFDTPVTLELIKERIKGRADDVILIFDEIHQACRGVRQGNLGERLKTLLDGEFPYVIGATTDEEYAKYILQNNDALARRFKLIPIDETNKDQTLAILNNILLRNPGIIASREAVEAAYELSKQHFSDRPQPYMACRILSQAIAKVKDQQASRLKAQIEEQQAILEKNLAARAREQGAELLPGRSTNKALEDENARIRQKIEHLQHLLDDEKKQIQQLKQLCMKLQSSKESLFKKALQIEKSKSKKIDPLLKKFVETSYYLHIAWDKAVNSRMAGQPASRIDKILIQEIVESELKLKAQKDEMLKKMKERKQGQRAQKNEETEETEL